MKRNIILSLSVFVIIIIVNMGCGSKKLMNDNDENSQLSIKSADILSETIDNEKIICYENAKWGYNAEAGTLFITADSLNQSSDVSLARFDIIEDLLVSIEYKVQKEGELSAVLQGTNEIFDLKNNATEKIDLKKGTYEIIMKGKGSMNNLNINMKDVPENKIQNIDFMELNRLVTLDSSGYGESLSDLPDLVNPSDEILKRIFGEVLPHEYTMSSMKGAIDNDKFVCSYETRLCDFKDNYVILSRLDGIDENRNIQYSIKTTGKKCKLILNNEDGTEEIIAEGNEINGVQVISLKKGANCIRLYNGSEKCDVTLSINIAQ